MEEITVYVGMVVGMSGGQQQDTRRKVVFEGEEVGTYREYGQGRNGGPTDTRGTIKTLYRTPLGYVAHVEEWSHWQGEPNTETLYRVTEKDLEPGGRFYDLACACDLGRPLTLEEALDGVEAIEPEEWDGNAPAG
jgi:hypothetical protein